MVIKFNKRSLTNFKYCPFALSLSKHNHSSALDKFKANGAVATQLHLF